MNIRWFNNENKKVGLFEFLFTIVEYLSFKSFYTLTMKNHPSE